MSATSYLSFARANARFVTFGLAMTFASSVGQTFFIGAFGPAVRGEFGLSHTAWSGIYMIGTLLSAAVLPWTGQMIDRWALRRYATLTCLGLVAAAAFMAAVPSVALLAVAIFLLRHTGQGLASHIGTTAMARQFDADRGKAVALASLGFAVGEAMLPFVAVVGIAVVGWRATYGAAAAVLLVCMLPAVRWLLHGHERRSRVRAEEAAARLRTREPDRSWSRTQVLRHGRFYLLLPALMAPSFVGTALFFHQLALAELKGWDAAWLTGSYWIYAIGTVLASLVAGPLIDRVTTVRLMPVLLLPMALGLLIVWGFDGRFWAWPYLLLIGLTSGLTNIAVAAVWAEVYGLRHLGSIRSLVTSLSVLSSSMGPLVMGAALDAGVSIETICLLFALLCVGATGLMLVGLSGYRRPLKVR